MGIRELLEGFLDLLYPPLCILCGDPTGGPPICERCLGELPRLPQDTCKRCGKPFESCVCSSVPWGFVRAVSVFFYGEGIRSCILRLKETRENRAVDFLAQEMTRRVGESYWNVEFSLVVSVPMNPKKLRSRGFNHADLLARSLSEKLGVPYGEDCLVRLDNTQIQHQLNAADRYENARRTYRPAPGCRLGGETVLLVDDVMTTGATLHWCATYLRQVGAKKVYCISAATVA